MKKAISVAFVGVLALALFSGCASAPLTYKGQPLATIDTSNWTQNSSLNSFTKGGFAFIKSSDGCTMAANTMGTQKDSKFVPGIWYLTGIDKGVDTSTFPIGTWKLNNSSSTTLTFDGKTSGGTVVYNYWNTSSGSGHTSTIKANWSIDGNVIKLAYGQASVASLVPGFDFYQLESWNSGAGGTPSTYLFEKGFDSLDEATACANTMNSDMSVVSGYKTHYYGTSPLAKYKAVVLVACDVTGTPKITSVRIADNSGNGAGSKRWNAK
jgi:hypothetical protein